MYVKNLPLTACLALCLLFTACSKEELQQETANSVEAKLVIDEPAVLKKFLSVTLDVSQDVIIYDKENDIFYIPNTVFKESYETIKNRYNSANEYKLNNPD